MDTVIDRPRLEHLRFAGPLLPPERQSLEALIVWADDAQEELYELKALVEQRGWHKGQAEKLAALMARWPKRG